MAIEVGDAVWRIKGDTAELEKSVDRAASVAEKAGQRAAAAAEKAAQRAAAAAEKAAQREIAAAEKKAAREQAAAEKAAAAEEKASQRAAAAAEKAAQREQTAAERKAAREQSLAERAATAEERASQRAAAAAERAAAAAMSAAQRTATAAERAAEREATAAERRSRMIQQEIETRRRLEEKAHQESIDRIDKLGMQLRNVGQGFRNVGYIATAAGAGIVGSITGVTAAAIDWESAFTGVRKTVDGTDAQLNELGMGIRQLSREIPVSAVELAKFAEIGGQMGVPRDQILAFTKTIAILGTTTNIAGEEGAAMLAKFANVAQVPQGQYSNLAASIVALGNAGSATEADIMMMAQRLAAAGTLAGMSAGDILGFSNALAGVGIEAEAGGTAFSKLFIDITNATKTGGEQLDMLAQVAGQTSEQFIQSFQNDPAEAIVSFVNGLARMQSEGYNLFQVMDALGYTEVRMRNAILSSVLARDQMTASVKLGNEAFKENNAHTAEAEKRFATTASQMQMLKNTVVELAVSLGEALLPSVNYAMQSIRPFLDKVIEWAKANPELVATIMKVAAALGAMLLILGPVLIAVGAFIGVLASVVTAIAAVAAAPVSAIFAAIGAAVVAAIGMILAAVAAMVYYWDTAVANLTAIWQWMSDTFFSIFGPILDAIAAMTGWGIGPGSVSGGPGTGMATGGTVNRSGWAVVGERGPELVQMPQGATVYDAQQSAPILQGGGTTNSQNVTVNFNRDSVRSDDDIRQIERVLTRLISTGMTANGTRAFA